MEGDLHCKLGCTGGQGKEYCEKIEYVKIACGSFRCTHLAMKDVDVLAKTNMLNSYIRRQSHIPCACLVLENLTDRQYYRCKALRQEAVSGD